MKDNDPGSYSGNIGCAECGEWFAESLRACPYCCPHNSLKVVTSWDFGLEAECEECGANWFTHTELEKNYRFTRKDNNG